MRVTQGIRVAAITAVLTSTLPGAALAQDAPRAITFDEAVVQGVTWGLSEYADGATLVDVPAGVTTSLLMEDGRTSGFAGCNEYSGTYEIDEHIVRFSGEVARTQAFCDGAAGEVEDAYLALLRTVVSWSIVDGRLELYDGGELPVLVFGDGTFEVSMSQMTAITQQLDDLQDAVAELQLRMSNVERASSGTSGAETKPARARPDGTVERQFAELGEDPNRGLARWRDKADDEDGYRVYARRIGCAVKGGSLVEKPSGWVRLATLPPNAAEYRPRHLQVEAKIPAQSPRGVGTGSLYELAVAPFNQAGEAKRTVVAAYFTTPEYSCS